jgi:DNA-binding NtrC family response regulator
MKAPSGRVRVTKQTSASSGVGILDDFVEANLIGESPAFMNALHFIRRMAVCDATVLIQGETGTGKELAARAVHYLSARRDFPFTPVNCGALPDNLIENEMYGHEKGAFTDAQEARRGLIALSQGGTLFLDEVEAMSAKAQVVLLRFLHDHEYRPVGAGCSRTANVRIIASSNVDLEELVEKKLFRQDLLFRLNVLSLNLPPLRERVGDVKLLADNIIRRLCNQYRLANKCLDPDSVSFLNGYHWPGNVRELENLIHREFLLSEGAIITIRRFAKAPAAPAPEGFKAAKDKAVADFERAYLTVLLAKTQGNISHAARLAGKDRRALGKLVKKHGLETQRFKSEAKTISQMVLGMTHTG